MVAVGRDVPERESKRLRLSGCEVLVCEGETHAARLAVAVGRINGALDYVAEDRNAAKDRRRLA